MSNTVTGTVKWFNEAKGFGFSRSLVQTFLLTLVLLLAQDSKP
jgi:hypothetical protein